MHEHLPMFNLINMNGRVYDPALGRMLSPDNFIQSPGFTQNYNRYSYCLNNPLIYTDPSGMSLKSWWNDLMDIYHGMGEGFKIWGQYAGSIYAGAGYAMFTLYTGGHHSSWEGFNNAISIGSNIGGAVGYIYGNVGASMAKTVLSSFATYGIGAGLSCAFNNLNWIGSADRLWDAYNNRKWISTAEWLALESPGAVNVINTAFNTAGDYSGLVSLVNFAANGGNKIDLYKSKDPLNDVLNFMNSVIDGEVSGTIPDHFVHRTPSNGDVSETGISFAGELNGNQVGVFMHFSPSSELTSRVTAKGNNMSGTMIYEIIMHGTPEYFGNQLRKPRLITLTTKSKITAYEIAKMLSR